MEVQGPQDPKRDPLRGQDPKREVQGPQDPKREVRGPQETYFVLVL